MRTYRIMRRGARYSRWEELVNGRPRGEAYRGPRFQRVDGRNVPISNVVLVTYTTGMEIRLTEKGAKSLSHLGLVPILGTEVITQLSKAPVEADEETTDEETREPDIIVPSDWKDLPKEAKTKLASQIAGRKIKTVTMAAKIIEEHLAG